MRLLLIEDEPVLQKNIYDFLNQQGYSIDCASDGKEGLFLGSEHPYDVGIVDIGLPEINGIEVIQRLRQNDKHFPILILTARGHWKDKVEGLEAGADDYLVNPFHNEELTARLNALMRRSKGHASPVLELGAITINTANKSVESNGQKVSLTQYEYNTLEYLALNHERVVSKTEITEHLYDQDFDLDSNVIEVLVGRLRRKIDPDGSLKPISTLRGQGYCLST
jgi:two-component system response regulator PhoP